MSAALARFAVTLLLVAGFMIGLKHGSDIAFWWLPRP